MVPKVIVRTLPSQARNGGDSYSACPTKAPAKFHTVSHALVFKVKTFGVGVGDTFATSLRKYL
jgi:hypothetical protein